MSEILSPATPLRPANTMSWKNGAPFWAVHVVAIVGVLLVDFSWGMLGLCIASYYLRMFGVTGGYHRYFSHKTYKLNRFWQFCMAFLAQTSTQKGALWWAAHHRHHHKYSDQSEDLHSPKQDGFWWSHVGWILSDRHNPTEYRLIPDLAKYPELRFLNHYYLLPPVLYAIAIFAVWGMPGLIWGFFMSTVLLWHGTFTINSLAHVFGSQRYKSGDTSRNNLLLALLTMGEGWHNNHHTYMSSANQGFFWWEIDPSFYILKAASWIGIVKDLRIAPVATLEGKRLSAVQLDEGTLLQAKKLGT